jgi:hypothetical protein
LSRIVERLGPDYFGITAEKLADEIELYMEDESDGIVDPVYRDKTGRRFIFFNAPGGKVQKYYLEEDGYHFEGDIIEIDERSEN